MSGATPARPQRRPTVADHDGRPMTRADDREALLMCFACGKPAYSRQQERCLNCGADREEQEMADYDPMVH